MTSSPEIEQHRARFASNPDDRAAFDFLEERTFMDASWSELLALYRARIGAPSLESDPVARAQILVRIGQVTEERLQDSEAAIAAYTEALRLDPSSSRALQQLRHIYTARRSWGAVLQIAEQQSTLVSAGSERARLFAEMGDIWLRELGDEEQAQKLYERARAESGGVQESGGVRDTEDVGRVRGAWISAARGNTEEALESLESALESDPANIEAIDMMLTLLEGAERFSEMPELLERRASLAKDPETRCAVLMRLGQIREQLGDLSDAREAYERAVAAHASNPAARQSLRRIYRLTESWSPLKALLESSVDQSEGRQQVDLLVELAQLLENHFDEAKRAREHYQLALDLEPGDERARAGLSRLGGEPMELTQPEFDVPPADGAPRGSRVVEVLERKLAHCIDAGRGDSGEAIRLRLRIGELRGGALGDPESAVAVLEVLKDDDATLLEAAPFLASYYEQLGRMDDLVDICLRAAELSSEAEQSGYWFGRAAECSRVSGDAGKAIETYERLIALRPGDHRARKALSELYRSVGDDVKLAHCLREELPRVAADQEFELQLELANLHDVSEDASESADDPDLLERRARTRIAHLRRCLELEPAREDLLEQALAVCERRGGALAQLDLVEHVVDSAKEPRVRAELLARRGRLFADQLQWRDEAAACWREALELDPQQALARARLDALGA